jgi:archaellum biogenesis ATPase FlaH
MVARVSPMSSLSPGSSDKTVARIPSKKPAKGLQTRIGTGGVSVTADRQNEEQILLAVLVDPVQMGTLIRSIPDSEFLVAEHQVIWKLFRNQANRAILGDFTDLSRSARGVTGPEASAVRKLVGAIHESSRAVTWADCRVPERIENLATDALKRRALEGPVSDILRGIGSPKSSIADIAAHVRRLERSLRGGSYGKCIIAPTVAHSTYMDSVRTGMAQETKVFGLGHPEFDSEIGVGFGPGETVVMTGGTGEGKSTVALNLVRFLISQGRSVVYCCWEEDYIRNTDKIVSATLGIPFSRMVQKDLTHAESERIDTLTSELMIGTDGKPPLLKWAKNPFIDIWFNSRDKKITNQDNLEAVCGIIADSGADVIIYDMWERMNAEGSLHSSNKALEFIHEVHKTFNICGILLGQMNVDKIVNSGAQKNASAIKGTKKMPEVADFVIILDRPDLSTGIRGPDGSEVIRFKIEKMRVLAGAPVPKEIEWTWDGARQRISDPRLVTASSTAGSIGSMLGQDSNGGTSPVPADGIPSDGDLW